MDEREWTCGMSKKHLILSFEQARLLTKLQEPLAPGPTRIRLAHHLPRLMLDMEAMLKAYFLERPAKLYIEDVWRMVRKIGEQIGIPPSEDKHRVGAGARVIHYESRDLLNYYLYDQSGQRAYESDVEELVKSAVYRLGIGIIDKPKPKNAPLNFKRVCKNHTPLPTNEDEEFLQPLPENYLP